MHYTFFPPLQDFRFVPYNRPKGAAYNYYSFDNALLKDQVRPTQIKQQYAQKVQYTDLKTLYILSTADSIEVKIFNDKGVEVNDIGFYEHGTQYSYQTDTGEVVDMFIRIAPFSFLPITYPEGFYYIKVKANYSDSDHEEFISEPIWVRNKHKDTILVKYRNDTNDYDVLFELQLQIPLVFSLRLPSDFMTLTPSGEDVVFSDQDENLRKLYGNPFRIFNLTIGGGRTGKGIPEYLVDKINRLLRCDRILIEGKRYTKHEGAELDQQNALTAPLQYLTVKLREYFNDAAGSFAFKDVKLLTRPGVFPWAYPTFLMYDGIHTYSDSPRIFEDGDDEDDFLTYLQNTVAPQYGMQGTFAWRGDDLYYTNAEDEAWQSVNNPVYKNPAVITHYIPSVGTSINRDFTFKFIDGDIVMDWGDGNIGRYHSFFGLEPTVTHTYTTSGSKTIRMFTDNNVSSFKCIQQFGGSRSRISSITGSMPINLRTLILVAHGFGANPVDLSFLHPCKRVITTLTMSFSGIAGITPGWASSLTPISFGSLRYIDFSYNVFSSTDVDNFFNELYNSCLYKPAGTVTIDNQNPLAPPTGASATSRGLLGSGSGAWGLYTD